MSDGSWVRRYPDLDPGARKPDGTKRPLGERVRAVSDGLRRREAQTEWTRFKSMLAGAGAIPSNHLR
jgi:hypothetical protein